MKVFRLSRNIIYSAYFLKQLNKICFEQTDLLYNSVALTH